LEENFDKYIVDKDRISELKDLLSKNLLSEDLVEKFKRKIREYYFEFSENINIRVYETSFILDFKYSSYRSIIRINNMKRILINYF
jgi:hypothetical protein